ncbi:hypothetical protein PHLCEN_2v12872 [Hermanssonia centrifuga]|uniref:BTB domain-containing protein n=1 Tax=Hermanssonia centrifuga TaxID=98765 RepID=A0A2R6NG29_9APHY|nr:hypothetical protein PHLCEN_2v12872 [Hermanssonia centrifuga]
MSPSLDVTLKRHPSLYFEDGDIVISVAASAESVQLFRVHHIFLANSSPVFRDMLSLPAGTEKESSAHVNEQYDGVPLVHCQDDPDDFAELLHVLYDPSMLYTMLEPVYYDTATVLVGLMSLSDKYCMDKIKAAIGARVMKDWPTTIDQYDNAAQACMNYHPGRLLSMAWDFVFPEPVAAIEFATKFNTPEILPAAFYHLATLDTSIKWTGMEYKPAGRWSELSSQNVARFIIGRDKLYKATVASVLGVFDEPCEYAVCDTARAVRRQDVIATTFLEANVTQHMDPLRIYNQLRENIGFSDVCVDCQFRIAHRLSEEKGVLWECLKVFFDLPNPQPT